MKKIILIPTRINSKRLPAKALLKIEDIPIIIHTYMRARLSKLADDVYVCTDSSKIIEACKKYDAKFIKTKSSHKNGTDRIAEAAKKLKIQNKLLVAPFEKNSIFYGLTVPKDINIYKQLVFSSNTNNIKYLLLCYLN